MKKLKCTICGEDAFKPHGPRCSRYHGASVAYLRSDAVRENLKTLLSRIEDEALTYELERRWAEKGESAFGNYVALAQESEFEKDSAA